MAGQLFAWDKLAYARGRERPDVPCILCEVVARRDTVTRLEVHRQEGFVVTLNLFPYNPGHLMVFPERHLVDPRGFAAEEVLIRQRVVSRCMDVLDRLYQPAGYNLGNNVGAAAGASIAHWHEHVVPRYASEIGFMEVVGGARVVVEHPEKSRARVAEAFAAPG